MPLSSKEMIRLLKKHGYVEVSQNGSHVKLVQKNSGNTVIVPYHCKDLKQAGIKENQ